MRARATAGTCGMRKLLRMVTRDLPMIMGTVLFAALLVTVSNFVVDLAYTWLDPRVKYS